MSAVIVVGVDESAEAADAVEYAAAEAARRSCVLHAHCPVAIVRPTKRTTSPASAVATAQASAV
jgi:nucleotide-binding universal stress UspA family protein